MDKTTENREIIKLLFRPHEPDSDGITKKFWCRLCEETDHHKKDPYSCANGTTNLISGHLELRHKDWRQRYDNEKRRQIAGISDGSVISFEKQASREAESIFGWLELIVKNNFPIYKVSKNNAYFCCYIVFNNNVM